MQRAAALVCLAIAPVVSWLRAAPAEAQTASPLAGVWTLNRSLSELPRELGFNVNWLPGSSGTEASGSSGGGRGRRGGGGGSRDGGFYAPRESDEDARRVQLMTTEARNPPARLMIVDAPGAVTITNELGQSRTLHPDGRPESIQIEGVPIVVTARRDADRLAVLYHVEQNREVRYTYSRSASPPALIVEVEFLEHGAGDKAKRVYEPGAATETAAPPSAAPIPASPTQQTAEKFDARPGAELKGLKKLGILVEDLSQQAAACGLNHDAVETAVSKRLTDGGFTVRRNSDEDSYVYINVMTNTLSNGTCVSRYDAFLYTHATANLSYRDQPVLVQVSLIHRGGLGSSAPAAHAAAVIRGLEGYIDLFVTQIHDAHK